MSFSAQFTSTSPASAISLKTPPIIIHAPGRHVEFSVVTAQHRRRSYIVEPKDLGVADPKSSYITIKNSWPAVCGKNFSWKRTTLLAGGRNSSQCEKTVVWGWSSRSGQPSLYVMLVEKEAALSGGRLLVEGKNLIGDRTTVMLCTSEGIVSRLRKNLDVPFHHLAIPLPPKTAFHDVTFDTLCSLEVLPTCEFFSSPTLLVSSVERRRFDQLGDTIIGYAPAAHGAVAVFTASRGVISIRMLISPAQGAPLELTTFTMPTHGITLNEDGSWRLGHDQRRYYPFELKTPFTNHCFPIEFVSHDGGKPHYRCVDFLSDGLTIRGSPRRGNHNGTWRRY